MSAGTLQRTWALVLLGLAAAVSMTALPMTAIPILGPGTAEAAWVSLGGSPGSPVEVTVVESTPERIVLHYVIPGFEAVPVNIDGKTYYDLSFPEESTIERRSDPELPHICRSVIISDRQKMQVREVEAETMLLTGYPVVPSKGTLPRTIDPSTVPFAFGPAYASSEFYPSERVSAGPPYILRDYRGLTVEVLPIQARGSDGSLRVAREMTVVLEAGGPDNVNTIDRGGLPGFVPAEFVDVYRNHFLNWGMQRYVPVQERGRMLIITHDAFRDALLPLVEWKQQQGIPTRLVNVSTIGNTSSAIDAYIANAFNTEGLTFVLLVGDAAQVATGHAGGGASDPSYATILGTDNYPEIFIGRFSAENISQAQTQVARTLTYERNPMAGATWYHKGTGIASSEGPGDDNEYDYEHMDVIRGKLLNYTYTEVDQLYPPATAAMVTTALNAGRSVINYCGHGDVTNWTTTGFSNANVSALQNDWMLPFIFSVACLNGSFESNTCFGEAWLRSAHNGNPVGAVGAYMSSILQSWNPPMCGQDECIDLLVEDRMRTYGGLCYNGSCQMMDEYGTDGANMFLTWHIFGDPSLMVRTDTPAAMTVQHTGVLFPGMTDYAVQVSGVPGAACALYGDGVLYGSALTDATGACTIHMPSPPLVPTTLTLTVTGYNRMPQQIPVQVIPPSGPYLVLDGTTVADAAGDGDGICDAGEGVGLSIRLRNVGIQTATGVLGTLSSTSEHVLVPGAERSYGNIPAGAIVAPEQPFDVAVSPNAPDQVLVPFHIGAQSAEGSWTADFSLLVQAPVLVATGTDVDDSYGAGNGDGGADPGETFSLMVRLANTGHSATTPLEGTLSCENPFVTLVDAGGSCLGMPVGSGTIMSGFSVSVAPGCPEPLNLVFHLTATNPAGYAAVVEFELPVGPWLDDAEADRGWSLGYTGDTATSGTWVRVEPVGTVFNGSQAQTEDDHTADPGTLCFVTGNGTPGAPAGESDVDGGKTTLVSPLWNFEGAVAVNLTYWRWYTNSLGNSPGIDWWDVQVTADGNTWVNLEHTQASANAWNRFSFDLEDFVPLTGQMRVRFVAEDASPGSLVEAAVDDILLDAVKPPTTGVTVEQVRSTNGLVSFAPNPLRTNCSITYRLAAPGVVEMGLYDVSGRLVRRLVHGSVPAGEHLVRAELGDLASGIYFLRLDTPQIVQVKQIAVLK